MKIVGFQKLTLVDYPGQIAATVFTEGCNFRCSFCYNPSLVFGNVNALDEGEILLELEKRKKVIDGVVICGGEPTIQSGLVAFAKKVKDLGLLVKLDTNGSNPLVIQELIDLGLVDYLAMDLKGLFEDYSSIVGVSVNLNNIKESIKIIIGSSIEHEFRTTVIGKYHDLDKIKKMSEYIKGCKKYCLQKFQNDKELIDSSLKKFKVDDEELIKMKEAVKGINVEVRS